MHVGIEFPPFLRGRLRSVTLLGLTLTFSRRSVVEMQAGLDATEAFLDAASMVAHAEMPAPQGVSDALDALLSDTPPQRCGQRMTGGSRNG